MPYNFNLVWVNKDASSSSLSNCTSEKATLHRIRSHVVTTGHKTSRIKRPLKRTPLNLKWTQKPFRSNIGDSCLQIPSPKDKCHNIPTTLNDPRSTTSSHHHLKTIQEIRVAHIVNHDLRVDALSGVHDPFSSHSIELNSSTLDLFWYFEHIWTQSAFKLPGCLGYGQPPFTQHEISSIIQECLSNQTRAYSLLAAASARRRYIHPQNHISSAENRQRHIYAAKALHALSTELKLGKVWEEKEATNIIFLAAYEVYCEDEAGAGRHLASVRTVYHRKIENLFVRRLQANLEILVAKSLVAVGRNVYTHDRPS